MKQWVVLVLLIVTSSVFAQPLDVQPLADETLYAYRARMEALFKPEIERVGVQALVEQEGSSYNQYLKLLAHWQPRLGEKGDFKLYFANEANQFRYHAGRRRAVRHDKDVESLANGAVNNDQEWQEIGPLTTPGGNGARGTGPAEALIFFANGPSRMLTWSLAGGLFYSRDGGLTWLRTGTDTQIGRSGVSSAAFHPTTYQTWFAASANNSGDGDPLWIGQTGGIFRTTNEGVTWTQIATPAQLGSIWTRIIKLAVNPSNGNELFAATTNGLYFTGNALATNPNWSQIAFPGDFVHDFEFRPGNPNFRYAAVATNGVSPTNWRFVYASSGNNWQPVPNQPASTANAHRLTIEVTPAKADNLYTVTIAPGGSATLSIYDFGANAWSVVTSSAVQNIGHGHSFGVDPFNANEIFLSHGTEGRRYTVGGTQPVFQFASRYSTSGTYHPDIEDLVPHPVNPNEVWMCHHGGVSKSIDNGATWIDASVGLGTAQVMRMSTASADPRYVALALYHAGTVLTTSPYFPLWTPGWTVAPNAFCDGLQPRIAPTGQSMWHSCQWGAWQRSLDFGQTFQANGPSSPVWVTDAALDALVPTTQYRLITAGGFHNISRTFDNGNTWTPISQFQTLFPPSTYEYILWRLAVPQTSSGYLVVHLLERPAGSNGWWNHRAFRTKIANDLTASNVIPSWHELPLPRNMWPSDIELEPGNPDVVYFSDSSSANFGSDPFGLGMLYRVDYTNPLLHTLHQCHAVLCQDLTQNLPNGSSGHSALALERSGDGAIYFATDYGVYYSNTFTRASGNGWTKLGKGLPNTGSGGIELNDVAQLVRVGTFGRGAWEHDKPATIRGTKFEDVNGDGIWSGGEPALANWTITLTDPNGNVTTSITNANGDYVFSLVPPGSYTIAEGLKPGWTQTHPSSGTHIVSVTAGQLVANLNFGNRAPALTSCVGFPPNIVAWWPLEVVSGNVTSDIAGANNGATLMNGPTIVGGVVNTAMHFNGTTQYLEVASDSELQPGTGDLSIDAWVRTTGRGIRPIVDKRGDGIIGYTLFLFDGRLGVQLADRNAPGGCSNSPTEPCTNYIAAPNTIDVADGNWHFVAVTIDRDSPTGGRLWVDGTIVMTFDPTLRPQSLDTSAPLLIARRSNVSSAVFWEGELDEIEIFRRALTAAEVQAIYKAGSFGKCRCNGPFC